MSLVVVAGAVAVVVAGVAYLIKKRKAVASLPQVNTPAPLSTAEKVAETVVAAAATEVKDVATQVVDVANTVASKV
jgi:hypothetical protein